MIQAATRSRLWQVFKVLWLLACFSILVLTVIYRGPENRDAVEAEILIMMGLSFPSGWLFLVLLNVLEMLKLFDMKQATELQSVFVVWVSLFALGYLQWFVLIPAVARWWRRKFGNSDPGNISIVPKN